MMNIGRAVVQMRAGNRVRRKDWGTQHYLYLKVNHAGSNAVAPEMIMQVIGDYEYGWVAGSDNLLAEDWEIVKQGGSE